MFDDVSINGNKLSKFENITQRKAIFDTGSSTIMTSETLGFYNFINGSYQDDDGIYHVPCDIKDQVTLIFGGISFKMDPLDLISAYDDHDCISAVQFENFSDNTQWLIGYPFLKNVYSVYNIKDYTIGLAPLS
ncbi:aspartic peptidase domain-containing protein [Gigaspora rosea]|uniref:Aspartic peptidase domain-containing protein n=1 Tax=Gigaspora rosea TaxID=44941 RepID=A0A397V154_9GLOM|nr:aspartic peptidase domain-containing protein [Gigaspora rosea]